jgi:phenylpropionate dioxygenase-like ring-hydroxylating dioxygenase large terminal subunit
MEEQNLMTQGFNFLQHWYPLSPVADLRSNYPNSTTLLGIKLVIWKPASSDTYRAFLDLCPHRLAPLSEGRVDEQGHLSCSYHGWQFDENGVCQAVPQAESTFLPTQQPQLCIKVFPSQVENDLFWVWPDPGSADLAAQTPLPLSPQIDVAKGFVWDSYVRDLEYDWQTLVENVVDPSHVPFTHHGLQGNRKQAVPVPIEIIESTADQIVAKTSGRFKTEITFEPPCRVEYKIAFGEKRQVGLVTYCIPTTPGRCRIVAQFPRNFARTIHRLTPRWWTHIMTRNAVLDGDMIILRQQEEQLQAQQHNWQKAYKLPTSADRFVIEFRKWFDRYCEGQLDWNQFRALSKTPVFESAALAAFEDRHQMLDRYRQHTQHCSSCRNALTIIQRSQWALLGYFILCLVFVALFPENYSFWLSLVLSLSALTGLGIAAGLKFGLEPKFRFVDYIHQNHA